MVREGMSRFTVTVPTRLLEALDHKLTRPAESRSATVRRLLEAALQELEEQENIERYLEGYHNNPQTEEELGWSDHATREHPGELSWQ